MAYEGYLVYNGVEIVNVARTYWLARTLGVTGVRVSHTEQATLMDRLFPPPPPYVPPGFSFGPFGAGQPFGGGLPPSPYGFGNVGFGTGSLFGHGEPLTLSDEGFGEDYFGYGGFGGVELIAFEYSRPDAAPWFDIRYPASTEFAGILPSSLQGLGESSSSAPVTEYITDGGNVGRSRNSTQVIVGDFIFVGSTERGVEYGIRWLSRVLSRVDSARTGLACTGADLHFLRDLSVDAEMVHRRDVALTRGASITNKRVNACSAAYWVTLTLTDAGGFVYGEPATVLTDLGSPTPGGPAVVSSGSLTLVHTECPVYDYEPFYDPLYPALIPSPQAPNLLPEGWGIENGDTFRRDWVRIEPLEPTTLRTIPVLKLTTDTEARMVRVSVWPGSSAEDDQCEPLFSVVVSYLPPGMGFYVDAEREAAYLWDGLSPSVRRTDSLIYSPQANPVQWTSFNDPAELLVTLDTFEVSPGTYEGDGSVRADLSLIPKSD